MLNVSAYFVSDSAGLECFLMQWNDTPPGTNILFEMPLGTKANVLVFVTRWTITDSNIDKRRTGHLRHTFLLSTIFSWRAKKLPICPRQSGSSSFNGLCWDRLELDHLKKQQKSSVSFFLFLSVLSLWCWFLYRSNTLEMISRAQTVRNVNIPVVFFSLLECIYRKK